MTARSLLEESLALYKDMGDRQRTAQSLSSLAKVATIQGDNATARALYEESLAFARVGHKLNIACGLEGLASVIAAQAEPSRAAQLWGAAEALRETIGAPIPPIERAGYDRAVAAVRVDLGEKVFAARWAEGRSMAPEQALAMQGGAVMSSPISVKQSSTPSTKPPATYPDELTAREVDVLRLVAMGLTDVQVAEKLTISPRTVNAHLTSIYSKIHISSRSAATRYAIEQHLV